MSSTLEFGRMHICCIKAVVFAEVDVVSTPVVVCLLGLLEEVQVSVCPTNFAETLGSLKISLMLIHLFSLFQSFANQFGIPGSFALVAYVIQLATVVTETEATLVSLW